MKIEDILALMLEPYNKECRYLFNVDFNYPSIKGDFTIPSSCYVKDTGHFNAIELIICYNQLSYTFFAASLNGGLLNGFPKIPVNKFKKMQLENSVIAKIENIKFRKQINPKKFSGSVNFENSKKINGLHFFHTSLNFWDDNEGNATGDILLALV